MSKSLTTKNTENQLAIENALIQGDLAGLNIPQRLDYVKMVCKSVKLNPLTRPFDYIKFEGKTLLYLNRGGAEQLRMIHKISTKVVSREHSKDGIYTVVARASTPKGREEESIGVVSTAGLRGKELANAMMKCETKAKRRATLAICGLSTYDAPTGDDDPVRETANQERIEQVTEQAQVVTATVDVQKSEGDLPPAPTEPPQQEQEQPKCYIMRAGKNKGKPVNDLSEAKLKRWMDWFNSKRDAGHPMHPDVQDDAFHVAARLQELKINDMQTELQEMKNGK